MNISNVLCLNFSSRKNGNCATITKQIMTYYTNHTTTAYVMNDQIVHACGNCNYECLTPGKGCLNLSEEFITIMDHICNADLVYFIVPNYCGFPCANYFSFNENTVGYFNGDEHLLQKYLQVPKRFIIVSNTEDMVFKESMQQQTDKEPDILYMQSAKYNQHSIDGNLMDSDEARADLTDFLSRMAD